MEKFFNPSEEQYAEVADLPEEQRGNYVDVGSGDAGFVEKSAVENEKKAKIAARFLNVPGEYILHAEAQKFDAERSEVLKKLDQIAESPEFKSDAFMAGMEMRMGAEDAVEFSPFKKELYDSEDVVRKYMRIKGGAAVMKNMSERLRNDKQFVLELLNMSDTKYDAIGGEISWLPENMSQDPDIIMAAMRTAPIEAFSCAPREKQNDLDFIATTLDAIERVYKPDMRLAAMNSLLGMIDPALAQDIREKQKMSGVEG